MSKYQPGDYRRNACWRRETRRQRREREVATQRVWTVSEWARRCEDMRVLMADGHYKREAIRITSEASR